MGVQLKMANQIKSNYGAEDLHLMNFPQKLDPGHQRGGSFLIGSTTAANQANGKSNEH